MATEAAWSLLYVVRNASEAIHQELFHIKEELLQESELWLLSVLWLASDLASELDKQKEETEVLACHFLRFG